MPTYLLSDLHLMPGPSEFADRLIGFLEQRAPGADAVYLLGDLFEAWIGDDIGVNTYARETAALAALCARGTPVFFQRGNRDFLVGTDFSELTGVQLLPDPVVVDLYGTSTLLSHGDVFCTDDAAYQRWRRFSRNRVAQWLFLRLPRSCRDRIARSLRGGSDRAKSQKTMSIMDASDDAVRAAFERHGVRRIVHGHTHRPANHVVALSRGTGERIVLADWRPDRQEILEVDAAGLRRIAL